MSSHVDDLRSGFVTLVGRPNVGKSTLINQMADQKIAIVSDKPQTTRRRIQGVVNRPGIQLVVVDTPGFHKPKDPLGKRLNKSVRGALRDVDAVVFLVDAAEGIGKGDMYLGLELNKLNVPILLALNKTDRIDADTLSGQLKEAKKLGRFKKIVTLSALKGTNVEDLIARLAELMQPGPRYYPAGMETDLSPAERVAELIREQALALTKEEIPYCVAVEVEEMTDRPGQDLTDIRALIYVERDSQKGILIGQNGRMILKIGQRARKEIEALIGKRVYLELTVKLKKDWRRDERMTAQLGYGE